MPTIRPANGSASHSPTQDAASLQSDILGFMNYPAGRSQAIARALASVLIPDVMTADLSQTGEAAYLGYETGGFTSTIDWGNGNVNAGRIVAVPGGFNVYGGFCVVAH